MRLLSLTANQPSFHSVNFNREGLSLIVAEQRTPKANQTGTYNGVGKSLMLELLHFCLGANANKRLQAHLKEWVFSLTIEVDGVPHTIVRAMDKPSVVVRDEESISLAALRAWLGEAAFEFGDGVAQLTFRSLVQRFIRSGRGAYNSFFYTQDDEKKDPYGAMLRNAFLLGLDLGLAETKRDLRRRQEDLTETMKQLESDPLFADLLAEDKVDVELTVLHEQVDTLQASLRAFRIAEDYHAIGEEANQIKRELDPWRRESVKLSEAMAQIDRSLATRGDLPKERVFQLYEEANHALPEQLRRRVEEVLQFQRDLQQRRIFRLTKERQELDKQLKEAQERIASLSAKLNAKMRYLSEHRALDEYVAVNNELSELQRRVAKLEESKQIRERVDKELKRIRRDLADQNIQTDEYLGVAESLISEATARFRSLTRDLYGPRPSGLVVRNDEGENKQRYKIDAHIAEDAAEGINEAKIFCYDVTLLTLRRGHRVHFLVHDSTLFGAIDPRQRLAMFRVAERIAREAGIQYIATLNLHDITSIREQVEIDPTDLERLFGDASVVLRLADDSPKNKLLGIAMDMNYLE